MSGPRWPGDDEGVEWPEEWLRDAGLLDDEEPEPAPMSEDVTPARPPEAPSVPSESSEAAVEGGTGDGDVPDGADARAHDDHDVGAGGSVIGHRRRARERQRRQRRRRIVVGLFTALLAFALGYGLMRLLPLRRPDPIAASPTPSVQPSPSPSPQPQQDTLLLVRQASDDGPAAGITLLAASPGPQGNAIIFLPEGTLVDIPGFGLDRLGLAQQYGGAALVEASVENLVGIDIDHAAAVSNSGLAAFLARTGGLDLSLDEQLIQRSDDGRAEIRFEPGAQFLDGERLVEYWGFRQRAESELDTFPRQQLVWGSLLQAAADPAVAEALVAGGVPQFDTSADSEFVRAVIERLAVAQNAGELDYTLLPVEPFGAADDAGGATYRPARDGMAQLLASTLAGSVPSGGGAEAVRIQVLNGVGTPGIGQAVDRRLEGAGFKIVLTDNARSFDFADTRILVYREDEGSMAAAREVQRLLGVGTIQISRQPQSVVDLTIVVGADFTAGESGEDDPLATEEQTS